MANIGELAGRFLNWKSYGTNALVGDKSFPFHYWRSGEPVKNTLSCFPHVCSNLRSRRRSFFWGFLGFVRDFIFLHCPRLFVHHKTGFLVLIRRLLFCLFSWKRLESNDNFVFRNIRINLNLSLGPPLARDFCLAGQGRSSDVKVIETSNIIK